jgi:hypothetical protein
LFSDFSDFISDFIFRSSVALYFAARRAAAAAVAAAEKAA